MHPIDSLARGIAGGTSRRDIVRQFGSAIATLALSPWISRRAMAQSACGTCDACDFDTGSCGQPCDSASAGTALCTQVSQDGSYLRLTNYLSNNSFAAAGASNITQFYQAGQLNLSGLSTNFANSADSTQTATLLYTLSATGDIATFVFVSQNGVAMYGLSVDYNGRIIQTIFTQQTTSNGSAAPGRSRAPARSARPSDRRPAMAVPRTDGVPEQPSVTFQQICEYIVPKICGSLFDKAETCETVGTWLCGIANIGDDELLLPLCEGLVQGLCGKVTEKLCDAYGETVCACPANTQPCDDPNYPIGCCPSCMNCQDKVQCVAVETCQVLNAGPCCGSRCCPPGSTCDTTTNPPTCMSPNSGCLGATCQTFVPCSSSNPDCVCATVATGGGVCTPGSTQCDTLVPCSGTSCPSGSLCVVGTCCGSPVCIPASLSDQCPAETPIAARPVARPLPPRGHGPTVGHR